MIKIVGNKEILEIVSLFLIVMIVGFLLTVAAVKTSSVGLLIQNVSSPAITLVAYGLDAAIAMTIILLIATRHRHRMHVALFKLLEAFVVAFTSFIMFMLVLLIFFPQFAVDSYDVYAAAVLAISLVLVKNEFPVLKNLATMLSSIGVGIILGFNFDFNYALLIMAVFAVYDYLAVFRSNKMVAVAKELSARNLSFLISVSDLESVDMGRFSASEVTDYEKRMHNIGEDEDPKYKSIIAKGRLPVLSQISLGEGDLSMPLMIVISAYNSFVNPLMSVILLLGAMAGIVVTMMLLRRYTIALPAIPPLFSFACIAAGIGYIVIGQHTVFSFTSLLIILGGIVMLIDAREIIRRRGKRRLE